MLIALENFRFTSEFTWHLYTLDDYSEPLCKRGIQNFTGNIILLENHYMLTRMVKKFKVCKICERKGNRLYEEQN